MFFTAEEAYRALGFSDRKIRLIGIPLMGLLIPLLFFPETLAKGPLTYSIVTLISIGHTLVFWVGNRWIVVWFRLRFPSFTEVGKRLIAQFFAVLVFTISASILIERFIHSLTGEGCGFCTEQSYWEEISVGLTMTFPVLLIYECVYFFQRWKTSLQEAEALKLTQVRTQLESLKNQVNPHFLFNSLNTLTSLIPKDPQRAIAFVEKLSLVYRYLLEIDASRLVLLKEEMGFLEAYMFLLKQRHGEKIQFEVELKEQDRHFRVVALATQILVENAVKHNVVSEENPLTIRLAVEEDWLVVSNPLQAKVLPFGSTGLGLANIQERYHLLSERQIEVEKTETDFIVRLPLIQVITPQPLPL
ncbi:MAG: histidine kinase [Bacteroidota bacterium]